MPKNRTRMVHHYDWKLRPSPNITETADARFYPEELSRLLRPRVEGGESVYSVAEDSIGYRIVKSHLNTTGGFLTLLIQHTDTTLPDPIFVNRRTWQARRIAKGTDDGIGACCHVVIALNETYEGSQAFRTIIEKVSGISRSIIERLLNSELKIVCEGNYTYKNQRKKDKNVRPLGSLDGLPSDQLIEAIKDGRLDLVSLVSQASVESWDEPTYVKEGENILRLSIESSSRGERAIEFFNSLFGKAKEQDYKSMRLRFRENGRAQNVEIDLQADTIEDTLLNKVSSIDVETPLDSYAEVIRSDLVAQMVELLRQE